MTRPDGFWNDKTNTQPYPDRARYRWMDWLVLACGVIGAIGIMGSWYG